MSESAVYRLYRRIRFALPKKNWRKLPRPLTHRHEYLHGELLMTGRPKVCNVHLPLESWSPPASPGAEEMPGRLEVSIQLLVDHDWGPLAEIYHSAFARLQPLQSWNQYAAATASRAIMRWSKLQKDGPLLKDACFTARARPLRRNDTEDFTLCGTAIVTLIPFSHWLALPDTGDQYVPHLDWIFVSQSLKRSGVATLLLEDVVRVLRSKGYRFLASSFVTDNIESMQWHWRNGFVMARQPYGASKPARFIQ